MAEAKARRRDGAPRRRPSCWPPTASWSAVAASCWAASLCSRSRRPPVRARLVETRWHFKRLEAAEIEAYLAGGEWQGKAGGYAIQGRAAAFVAFLSGSYSNVVGLPLFETVALLKSSLP
jgi:predicted house-cleaning NTP pyrophosphatase (Maf/HAM1 superfamily)